MNNIHKIMYKNTKAINFEKGCIYKSIILLYKVGF